MLVVLAHASDWSARYACEGLRRQTGKCVEWVEVESLARAVAWRQEIASDRASVEIRLPDGRLLQGSSVRAVLNRVITPPPAPILAASLDAGYAYSELTAFAASWLRGLGARVVNEPTPQGLSGRWRSSLAWRVLAREAGLPVESLHLVSSAPGTLSQARSWLGGRTLLTVEGEAYGSAPPRRLWAGLRRLAELAATPILGVRFSDSKWRFLDATPLPDFVSGGEAGVAAIARLLTR
jgi:hypothetical protein